MTETYKGVEIEYNERTPGALGKYSFSLYPMFALVGRERDLTGGGSWNAKTLADARADIDVFLRSCGLTEVPAPRPWAPPEGADRLSISAAALAARIKTMRDAMAVANAIDNPMLQARDGLCLLSWRYECVPRCIRFARFNDNGEIQEMVAAVETPEPHRGEFAVPDHPPTTILMVG